MASPASPPQTSEPSNHMRRLFRDDERHLWSTKPNKKAFYVANILVTLLALAFLSLFTVPFLAPLIIPVIAFLGEIFGGTAALALVLGVVAFGLLSFFGAFPLAYLVARFRYKHAEYALTDDRVLATSGLVGRDSSTISLKDVRDVDTNVGILDKIFDTGNIRVQVAGGAMSGLKFSYLDNPYDVMKTVEDARKKAEEAAQGGAD